MTNERKTYAFRSSGKLSSDLNKDTLSSQNNSIGFKTPLELSNDGVGPFKMHTVLKDQIKDNFRNLLLTNHGERLVLGDFGANLSELSFEFGNPNYDELAISRISSTVKKYMPFIELTTFETLARKNTSDDIGQSGFRIKYSVPSLGLTNQIVDAVIYVDG